MNNHRYIHLKDWLPRLVETITADMMKDDIFEGGTKFQIEGVPGHRMEEHLLSIVYHRKIHISRSRSDHAARGYQEIL